MLSAILIIIGTIVYAIIGNFIIRVLDDNFYIEVTPSERTLDEISVFVLGMIFPLVLFYVLIKLVSIYIYDKIFEN